MSRSPTLLDLRELPLSQGQRIRRTFDVPLAAVVLGGETYQVVMGPGGVEVEVERVSGGFLLNVAFSASVYGPCFRCLREVKVDVSPEQKEFIPLKTQEWSPEDISPFVKDLVVDVAGLAREALILDLPLKILCSEDCPGLCPTCGKRAHEGACEDAEERVDPRWAKLKDLHLE